MQLKEKIINDHSIKLNPPARNHAIDFTKGFLVVVMIAYHLLNYFLEGGERVYMYLNYVTGGFIFISGLLCSTIYYNKFLEDKLYVHRRLFIRGFKLITIFFLLNIFTLYFLNRNFNAQINNILNNLHSILVIGNEQFISFGILLGIAYVLLISNILLYSYQLRFILYTLLIIVIVFITIKDIPLGSNLYYILIGIGGFYSGFIYPTIIPKIRRNILNIILAFLLFFYFIVAVPLGIRRIYFIYYVIINVVLASAYYIGKRLNPSKIIIKNIIIFGQYSLFSYIAQLIIIQILAMIIKINIHSLNIAHLILFIFTNICLSLLCNILILSRKKIKVIDKMYRFIFA